ncbi:DUF7008 domain-containing protein [Parafrankia sp. FMc2]|uniref:DUF7008 domain-containing protein n=1 Tax=Parafrankia sp. FMc2 TaxID=3233196 RepID=UPI0034D65428
METGQLADELAADADFVSVAEIYRPGEELAKVAAALVADEHVPFLAALRYADTCLVKRADWESVWEQQRAEDAAPTPAKAKEIRDAIPVPPKYAPKDFRKTSFWRARGKLDVPKERFISYQPAGRDNDPTLLIGWAGFDHREQAQALATLIVDRRDNDGWDGTRLTPLVAGLREVMPWVRQWHNEVDPLYDGSPAEVYDAFLADTMGQLNLTEDDLRTPLRAGARPLPLAAAAPPNDQLRPPRLIPHSRTGTPRPVWRTKRDRAEPCRRHHAPRRLPTPVGQAPEGPAGALLKVARAAETTARRGHAHGPGRRRSVPLVGRPGSQHVVQDVDASLQIAGL